MKKYFIFLLGLATTTLLAQVQFEAKVSKNSLGLNERLRVDFEMNADGDNFSPPNFEGFRIVGGPSQQVSQSWVNGRSSFQKAYSYYLVPLQKGTLTIKQASVEINDHIYKTNPIKVTVTNAIEEPRDPNSIPQISSDQAISLVSEISKTNPYLNEPITVVYKLLIKSNYVGVSNPMEVNKPKYNDFWSQNIDIKQLVAEEGVYNGERIKYVVLKKVILYPQKAGKLAIEPLSLDVNLELPTNRRNIFGQVQVVEETKRVSTGQKTINVKALPESGKPEDFSGAVGNFSLSVTPNKTNLKSGESLDLKVVVAGKGNLKLFDIPKPVVPNSFEMYDPINTQNVQTPLSGMTGSITNSYTIIPQFKGKYPIKPMSFTYFDLNTNSYKKLESPEIMINVMEGPMDGQNAVTSNSAAKNKISVTEQFKYIKSKTTLTEINPTPFLGSSLFYSLFALPFLCIPALILFRRKKEALDGDILGNKIKRSNALAKKYLSDAKKHINDKKMFYISLEKALHNFLKAKLHIETSEMSKVKISELLLSKKANSETVIDFIKLTENCEFARYAPSSNEEINQDFEKAVAIISDLEKQISN